MKRIFARISAAGALSLLFIMLFAVTVFADTVSVTYVTPNKVETLFCPRGADMSYLGPTDVNIEGFAFCGWDVPLARVMNDTVAFGVYIPIGSESQMVDASYFYHNLPTGVLSYSTANKDTIPEATANSKFMPTVMTQPGTLTAQESINLNPVGDPGRTCVVKWYNGNTGELWKTDIVPYGSTLPQPENPCIDGLEFVGWDGSWSNITTDRDIKACFYKEYHVVLKCYVDGAIMGDKHVRQGDSLEAAVRGMSLYDHRDHLNKIKEWDVYFQDDCTAVVIPDPNDAEEDYDGDDDDNDIDGDNDGMYFKYLNDPPQTYSKINP